MPSFSHSVFTGVFSGILTALAIAVLVEVFRKIVLPWYQAVTYSGINLSGSWHAVDPTMAQRIELVLHQNAKSLKGHAVFTYRPDEDGYPSPVGYEPVRTFDLTGITQDRFVALTLRHRDLRRLGINCYLLEVIGDGRKMAGVFSFYSIREDEISESYQVLYRDRTEADRASHEAKEDLRAQQRQLFDDEMEILRLEREKANKGESGNDL
ncbi:MAG: hypothetical protein GX761_10545 [Gammaproteobacteria bacterium]|nr:hypothetical protein [Gammaproteobacteria bacterium]